MHLCTWNHSSKINSLISYNGILIVKILTVLGCMQSVCVCIYIVFMQLWLHIFSTIRKLMIFDETLYRMMFIQANTKKSEITAETRLPVAMERKVAVFLHNCRRK